MLCYHTTTILHPSFFIPLRRVGPSPAQTVLELVLRGGRIVRVPDRVAPDALRQLITLVEQLPC
jgi:hypothetical protein